MWIQVPGRPRSSTDIHIVARNNDRGFKLLFHKDRSFDGMRSLNMVFEGSEWSLLAEALAFDLYRRAGNPAPLHRVQCACGSMAALVGYHLAIERINEAFFSRNEVDKDGNLYKIQWTGRDIVGQHEKRTHTQQGHEDVVSITDRLEKTSGDEQWKVIQENFNVNEVATYFAVNMALSHWDGFFNNYFPYHDTENGKWGMYPWDQDKTWGYYDGLPDDQVFFDMPLTYGMAGDRPPGHRGVEDVAAASVAAAQCGGARGGCFSRPLLANPQFRKVFLDRTREILETIYTEETYFPLIEEMAERLKEECEVTRRGERPDGRGGHAGADAQCGPSQDPPDQAATVPPGAAGSRGSSRSTATGIQGRAGGASHGTAGCLEPISVGAPSPRGRAKRRDARQSVTPLQPAEGGWPTEIGSKPVLVIPAGARWWYLNTGSSPGADWTKLEFKDDAWPARTLSPWRYTRPMPTRAT